LSTSWNDCRKFHSQGTSVPSNPCLHSLHHLHLQPPPLTQFVLVCDVETVLFSTPRSLLVYLLYGHLAMFLCRRLSFILLHVDLGPSQNATALQRYFDDQEAQSSSSQLPSSGSQSSFGLFSQLKEGAASIVKNVKDASAKVVETVS